MRSTLIFRLTPKSCAPTINQTRCRPSWLRPTTSSRTIQATDFGSAHILRRQAYWTALSGATGQLYGSKYTWQFGARWQDKLDTVGVMQLGHLKTFFAGYL